MSRPPRDERLRRQKFDAGDPEDAVWYVPSRTRRTDGVKTTKPRGSSYHNDPECQAVGRSDAEDAEDATRKEAKDAWLSPCTKCVLDGIPPKPGEDADDGDDDKPAFFAPDLRGIESGEEPSWP